MSPKRWQLPEEVSSEEKRESFFEELSREVYVKALQLKRPAEESSRDVEIKHGGDFILYTKHLHGVESSGHVQGEVRIYGQEVQTESLFGTVMPEEKPYLGQVRFSVLQATIAEIEKLKTSMAELSEKTETVHELRTELHALKAKMEAFLASKAEALRKENPQGKTGFFSSPDFPFMLGTLIGGFGLICTGIVTNVSYYSVMGCILIFATFLHSLWLLKNDDLPL